MHLYVMARGIKNCLEQWENDISAIFLPIKFNDNGTVKEGKVRVAVRPIQLYEIVFPEEKLDFMLETIPDSVNDYKATNKFYRFAKKVLRKAMGLQPAPASKHNGLLHAPFVGVSHIGIKKDARDKLGCEML